MLRCRTHVHFQVAVAPIVDRRWAVSWSWTGCWPATLGVESRVAQVGIGVCVTACPRRCDPAHNVTFICLFSFPTPCLLSLLLLDPQSPLSFCLRCATIPSATTDLHCEMASSYQMLLASLAVASASSLCPCARIRVARHLPTPHPQPTTSAWRARSARSQSPRCCCANRSGACRLIVDRTRQACARRFSGGAHCPLCLSWRASGWFFLRRVVGPVADCFLSAATALSGAADLCCLSALLIFVLKTVFSPRQS